MFDENDVVELAKDLPRDNLKAGNKGTILMVLSTAPPVYEIEFMDDNGDTLAVTTVYNHPLNLIWSYKKHNTN